MFVCTIVCILLQHGFGSHEVHRGLQTKHIHIKLAYHTQPHQQLKYPTLCALQKCTYIHQNTQMIVC